ncbi:helix-turn-helix domain-containing protein [Sneathiella glossodoripedis]|uniref:helix-turn-helix domain-containing protein n=1 Tax=Sneathiella glossodoripedis TaxID=418853 RepID=UPI0006891D1C|nr:helix-turn-helix transcriptional regulator [Sneathiella glossodoripedis]
MNAKIYSDIGVRLRAFRGLGGMNQKQFALSLGYNPTQYTNWETGARRIPVDMAIRLVERFGLTLDYIYLGDVSALPHELALKLK